MISGLFAREMQFDQYRAFQYLEKQVAFGCRVPGTEAHRVCRNWIIDMCQRSADTVLVQTFRAYRPVTKDTVDAYNIIARIRPEQPQRVMLSTHWDTRPFADKDIFYSNKPVPGANDGASGTAVLLEILECLTKFDSDIGIDIIFWDAEDMGIAGNGMYFCQGSEYYAYHPIPPIPQIGILIDMIGDQNLEIPIEANSMLYAPELVLEVWDIAHKLGYQNVFPKKIGQEIYDDHIPLNIIAGIPTIDLIDFHYYHQGRNIWHTVHDLPAYCSPYSLKCIGDILLFWLSRK